MEGRYGRVRVTDADSEARLPAPPVSGDSAARSRGGGTDGRGAVLREEDIVRTPPPIKPPPPLLLPAPDREPAPGSRESQSAVTQAIKMLTARFNETEGES